MPNGTDIALMLKSWMFRKGKVELRAHGYSMYPFIQENQLCRFIPVESASMKRGDVVLFHTPTGLLIAHRYQKKVEMDGIPHYVFKGDTNLNCDPPIREDALIGMLAGIYRRKGYTPAGSLSARLWGACVMLFPALGSILIRLRLKIRPNTGDGYDSNHQTVKPFR